MQDYKETAFGIDLDMVYVPGGEFKMGGVPEEGGLNTWCGPIRTIRLDAYLIGKYPITQAQWQKVMGTDLKDQWAKRQEQKAKGRLDMPHRIREEPKSKRFYRKTTFYKMPLETFHLQDIMTDSHPMCLVNWEEAQEFCKKLSEATGKHYVLPTEAQWEYAASGGGLNNDLQEFAWQEYPAEHTVGEKMPNVLGVYDMGGIGEWCSDIWVDKYDPRDLVNPLGPRKSKRPSRQKGWLRPIRGWRMAVFQRMPFSPTLRFYDFGFRVVLFP